MVGFDVLNIENLRYLISELHFDIKKEGVYLNGQKLSLTKLYYYRGGIYGSLCYDYSIDFVNKKINRPLRNHLDFPDEKTVVNLTEDECFFILNLIEKTGVYRWYHQDYLNRMKSDEFPYWMFDGTHWYFDLIFDDEYVMHLGGHEEYPDTYRYFASEIKELLDYDWFEVNRIEEKYVDDYKFWESKLID